MLFPKIETKKIESKFNTGNLLISEIHQPHNVHTESLNTKTNNNKISERYQTHLNK
jgi:hypothetical protein